MKERLDENYVSSDFLDALYGEVQALLDEAARRAEANDWKTVQARDY